MFITIFQYLGGFFLGWGLGANDSANVFGVAVASKMIKWRNAAVLTAIFVFVGALLQGERGIKTLAHDLGTSQTEDGIAHTQKHLPAGEDPDHVSHGQHQIRNAMIMSFSAALTIIIMTFMKLPVSTSQAVVGCIIGVNLMRGCVQWSGLIKVVICWIGTPIGGLILTPLLYFTFRKIFYWWRPSVLVYDRTMTILLVVTGCYAAYALGANNVANVSAVFVSAKMMSIRNAEIFGAIAIAAGVLTYSKPVMMTVGSDIVKLDAFMAFITVLSLALTVWVYALIGVPVSSTQAVVGSILGFAMIKGAQTINFKTLGKISLGWLATPLIGGVFSALTYFVCNLHYIPSD